APMSTLSFRKSMVAWRIDLNPASSSRSRVGFGSAMGTVSLRRRGRRTRASGFLLYHTHFRRRAGVAQDFKGSDWKTGTRDPVVLLFRPQRSKENDRVGTATGGRRNLAKPPRLDEGPEDFRAVGRGHPPVRRLFGSGTVAAL